MVDERTAEAFGEIARQAAERKEELHSIRGPCTCTSCMTARMKEIREKTIGGDPFGWYPELSSDPRLWEYSKRHHKQST